MITENGTVIVVEDDPNIADLVDLYLRREGYRVLLAPDGEKGLEVFGHEDPWIVILDVGLPGARDGFEVCRQIRARSSVPVLFLTARDDEVDRILGLELGADDYIVKPFSPREVVARVRAVLRRAADGEARQARRETLVFDDLQIDGRRREVRLGARTVRLTPKEFDLLFFLATNAGNVYNRIQLVEELWDFAYEGDPSTVTVHLRRLREKIEADPTNPRWLVTVWGVGYRFDA